MSSIITRWDPFRELAQLQNRVNCVFQEANADQGERGWRKSHRTKEHRPSGIPPIQYQRGAAVVLLPVFLFCSTLTIEISYGKLRNKHMAIRWDKLTVKAQEAIQRAVE